MIRLGAPLALAVLALGACAPDTESALGQRPTSYPAAGGAADAASVSSGPAGSVDTQLVKRATSAVEAALTYDHTTWTRDTAAAQSFMTPTFAQTWHDIAQRLGTQAEKRRASVTSQVLDAGVIGATTRKAQVLLFLDRRLESASGTEQSGGYAVAMLVQRDGVWRLSGLGTDRPEVRVVEQRPVPATVLAAAEAVADAYSDISADHPHADVSRVLSLTTGPFHRDYKSAAGELVRRTLASGASQDGTVVAVGLAGLGTERARAIAVVATTLRLPGAEPVRKLQRVEMALTLTRTAWRARTISLISR